MVSSLFQILIGFTGLVGVLLRFIGPITVAPTLALVGLSLFGVCSDYAGKLYLSVGANILIGYRIVRNVSWFRKKMAKFLNYFTSLSKRPG
jgi:xanthine/uracil permease